MERIIAAIHALWRERMAMRSMSPGRLLTLKGATSDTKSDLDRSVRQLMFGERRRCWPAVVEGLAMMNAADTEIAQRESMQTGGEQ